MDFYLNIGTITKGIYDYRNKYNILDEQKANIVSTVNWLAGIGWSGEAKDKFLEVFQEKMKLYEKLQEDIQYMINALEEEKQRALPLKTRCEDFVNCIERSGQGGSITGNDEGIISLDYSSQSTINNYVNNCVDQDYVKLNSNFNKIEDILSDLEFTSFGISGDVDLAKASIKNQTESLTEFDDSFNTYYNGVKDMESNICSVFSKISGVSDVSKFKSSSAISASGEIDVTELGDIIKEKLYGIYNKVSKYISNILGDYSKIDISIAEELFKVLGGAFISTLCSGSSSPQIDDEINEDVVPTNHVCYIFYQPGIESGDKKHSFYAQAKIEAEKYKKKYPGTEVVLVPVTLPYDFKQQWDRMDDKSKTIDAVQIILHGSIDPDIDDDNYKGAGFMYFEDISSENDNNTDTWYRIATDKTVIPDNQKEEDMLISELDKKKVNELYFSSCNSANPDAQNVATAFKDVVDANEITGWDGGTLYKYNDEEPEKSEEVAGGEGKLKDWKYKFTSQGLLIYPEKSEGQPTWWKYVPKNEYEWPARERLGKVRIK